MDILRESLELEWDGPLADATGLPVAILYGVILTFAHGAGKEIRDALRAALDPWLGEPARDSWAIRGRRLRWDRLLLLEVEAGVSSVTVRVGQRLKGRRLSDLVERLAAVPGARNLRLTAERRRHAAPGSASGPMLDG